METILKSLKAQFVKCHKLIERREKSFNRRSCKWQESDIGELYESDTLELESVKDNLEAAIKTLQEITGNYNNDFLTTIN